mmetsp:Transcript_43984/g.136421  ORF Transcript_43984/g.136421 Transcript_43984/m.136421 type:complete len:340 (+) Transcript_43984:112-1131(+)
MLASGALPLLARGRATILHGRLGAGRNVAQGLRGHAAEDHALPLRDEEIPGLLDRLHARDVKDLAVGEVKDDHLFMQLRGAEGVLVVHGRAEEERALQDVRALVGLVLVLARLHADVRGGRPREAEAAEDDAADHRDAEVLPHRHHRDEDDHDRVDPVDPQDEGDRAPGKRVQGDERDQADESSDWNDLHHRRKQEHAETQGDAHDGARDAAPAAAADVEEGLGDERAAALRAEERGDDVADALAEALAPHGAARPGDLVDERLRHQALQQAHDGEAHGGGDDLAPHRAAVPVHPGGREVPRGHGVEAAAEGRLAGDVPQRPARQEALEGDAEDRRQDD